MKTLVLNGPQGYGMRVAPCRRRAAPANISGGARPTVATRAKWRDALQGGGGSSSSSGGGSSGGSDSAALNGHASSNGTGAGAASYGTGAARGGGLGGGGGGAAGVPEGLINPQFAAVLSSALQRSGDDALFSGPASESRVSPLKPVEEMLMTALAQSRGNMRKLSERQAALEAEIAAEAKQASRLEWLLNRVRADYAYFGALDQMSQDE